MFSGRNSVVALTQGLNAPSARFRWRQYASAIEADGLDAIELPSRFGATAPASKLKRPGWLAATSTDSLLRAMQANRAGLRFLQKSLTATLCTWEPMLRRPFIFDVDDAVFLGNRGHSANKIARLASLTICGNQFLAEHFSRFGDVVVLPTAVDSERFCPSTMHQGSLQRPVIGWSGSSSGFKYLYEIEDALSRVLLLHPNAMLKIVADRPPTFRRLAADRVQYEVWSEHREVEALREFTVGLMPLADDLWSRGKCSFKMLTYMSVGLPVVVSPVGMNQEVLSLGSCGLAARSEAEWVESISCLLGDPSGAQEMGRCGRSIIEAHYAKNVVAPRLIETLRSVM